jgi:hypothetical protein
MQDEKWPRRSLISGLGASAAALAVGGSTASAQPSSSRFQPARHPQDEWFEQLPGKHRVFIDVISAKGLGEAIGFADNLYTANKDKYGIEPADLAMVMCLRHSATAFGFNDSVWSTHGKAFAASSNYTSAQSTEPPSANPYKAAPRNGLVALAARGLQFAICDMASHRLAGRLAGPDGDAEAIYKTMAANTITNGRFVPAGVIALTRSQEYGYSLLYAG